ncbi:MAG: hypothetical protein NC302_00145 [Bacteroidales bacterium]|nr:hypothetical protein [Bacteroidales bacterium]MCM1414317.1 hypothetical protein [bacterium]MCM1422197.1 hypothetical protein [bacterium]
MRKLVTVLILPIMILGLTCCGQEEAPEISSLSFNKAGEITHRIVGKTDQNYYQIETADLENFAASRVEEYCAGGREGSVVLNAVEEKGGSIIMDFGYVSAEDYSGFNNRMLYIGTLENAAADGYELEAVPFVSMDGQAVEIGFMEEQEKKNLVVLETKSGEEILVNLPGKTLYTNQSAHSGQEVTFVGKKSVKISNQDEEGARALSYIIYE